MYTQQYYSALRGKEILTPATIWMRFKNIIPVTKRQIPYESTGRRHLELSKFLETESRMAVTRAGEVGSGGMGNCCLMGTEFQFRKMKKVLEVGCTSV